MMSNIQIEQPERSPTIDEPSVSISSLGRCSICGKRAELVKSKWLKSETCPHCDHTYKLKDKC